ncbi:MAG: lamin tail domain-containing protein [Pseudomonadota bacterium]
MRYLIMPLLLLVLLLPFCRKVLAAEPLLVNNISNSQIYQYIYINCAEDQCEAILKESVVIEIEEGQDEEAPLVSNDEANVGAQDIMPAEEGAEEDPVLEEELVVPVFQYQQVRINEVVAVPASGEKEWVELYNATQQAIDLTGWQLIEGAGKSTELFGAVSAQGYVVFDKSALNNGGDIVILQDLTGKVIDQMSYGDWDDGALSDNAPVAEQGESVALFSEKYEVTAEPTPGIQNILFQEEPVAAVVVEEADQDVLIENTEIVETQATSAEATAVENSASNGDASEEDALIEELPVEYDYSSQIRINEVLPNPVGSDDEEWIELYNAGDQDVDLLGWTLDDAEGGSAPFKIEESFIIKAEGYLILERSKTGVVLNNDSDSVVLLDPAGAQISAYQYESCQEGASWAYFEGEPGETGATTEWLETKELTPGEKNLVSALEIASASENKKQATKESSDVFYASLSIADARQQELKTKVMIQGWVSVEPDIFSKTSLYLLDETGGLQLYFSKADWPELQVGDYISAAGTISQARNEKRLLIKEKEDLALLDSRPMPAPLLISSSEVTEDLVGSLVQLEAEFLEKNSSKLILADDQGEFIVYVKTGTGIEAGVFSPNDKLRVTGIISQVDEILYVQPRSKDDLENISWQEEEVLGEKAAAIAGIQPDNQGQKMVWSLFAVFIILAVISACLAAKKLSRRKMRAFVYKVKEFLGMLNEGKVA